MLLRLLVLFVYFIKITYQGSTSFINTKSYHTLLRSKRQSESHCVLPNHPANGEFKIYGQEQDPYLPNRNAITNTIIDLSCTNGTVTETGGLSRAICYQGEWKPSVSQMGECVPPPPQPPKYYNPCIPSPCGQFSECGVIGGRPSCSCLSGYIGSNPNCRPECVLNRDCPSNLACIRKECLDPCPSSCGANAKCSVRNHMPICVCPNEYIGDPFSNCYPKPPIPSPGDRCNPSPCGPNAICNDGACTCIPEYQGDPYRECRPECVLNKNCPRDKVCIRNKCASPCPGICGQNAECTVANHKPQCNCKQGYSGDPFVICRKIEIHPCNPSPCGPNSQCREMNEQAICFCLPGYIGTPPTCRPECVTNFECPSSETCVNQKCTDPCAGSCGILANCKVVNHSPICSCPPQFAGDPFVQCRRIISLVEITSEKTEFSETVSRSQDPCFLPDHPVNGKIKILGQEQEPYLPNSDVIPNTIIDLSCTNGTVTETGGLWRAICYQGKWKPSQIGGCVRT